MFGTEKLEWCGHLMVKIFRRYVYSFRQSPRMWRMDRCTDRWTDTTWRHRQCLHSIARKL